MKVCLNTARRLAGAGLLAGIIAACSPVVDSRGNLPNQELLAQVRPGATREDVHALLGTPSSAALFGEEIWYYVSSREERWAFLKPKELERKVIAIRFDTDGAVTEMKSYGLEDGRAVNLVDRTTPSAGTEMGIVQQLLGNVGRFAKPKGKDAM